MNRYSIGRIVLFSMTLCWPLPLRLHRILHLRKLLPRLHLLLQRDCSRFPRARLVISTNSFSIATFQEGLR